MPTYDVTPMTPAEVEDVRRCVGEATHGGARLLKRFLASLDAANTVLRELGQQAQSSLDIYDKEIMVTVLKAVIAAAEKVKA